MSLHANAYEYFKLYSKDTRQAPAGMCFGALQDLSVTVMSEKPITEVEIVEDAEEVHKIYKQSFIDEQEWWVTAAFDRQE